MVGKKTLELMDLMDREGFPANEEEQREKAFRIVKSLTPDQMVEFIVDDLLHYMRASQRLSDKIMDALEKGRNR